MKEIHYKKGYIQHHFSSLRRNGAGFTLVELLVVIAVIGLVASIIWVSLGGTTDKARIGKGESFDAQLYHVLGESLVGMWNLDGSTTALDSSGYGTTGGPGGNVALTLNRNNEADKAYSFDGSGDYISMGNPADGHLDFGTGDFTVSAWILRDSTILNAGRVLSKGATDANQAGYALIYVNTTPNPRMRLVVRNGDGVTTSSVDTGSEVDIDSDKWYHVVATRSGSTIRIYLDSVLRGTIATATTESVSNTYNFYIGARSGGSYWKGKIDDVRVYNSVFSLAQVEQLYAQGRDEHGNIQADQDRIQ
ncbi:MAG: prepilin-type N-terminal cleavage/methylation domain-containing protein [Candidatus Wildermuthbacteria bacterium]|nr:prepilin-type N-terminal cleavage/methylation domain-containing protein [Candidatus Wildermuthbacteria bacterium]